MSELPASPGGGGGGSNENGDHSPRSNHREQDRFLPIANISRIMKKVLPPNGKIAKDAKDTVQECVSEFISFITSEASDKCQREKRKTINGDDLLWAMATLGFEDYIDLLKIYLARYREVVHFTTSLPIALYAIRSLVALFSTIFAYIYVMVCRTVLCQGDTKVSAKGGDASSRKDVHPSPNAQVECVYTYTVPGYTVRNFHHQGSFSQGQGVDYTNSQYIE
ncbi:hypothetical protein Lal_00022130 [Lupinus albus]|nr:hypothetical protein Lal_00022130 [Lupinus albus]